MAEYLCINGECVTASNLPYWREGRIGMEAQVAAFLSEWFNASPTLELHTSGSTGTPKTLHANKDAMRASAKLSCEVFGLHADTRALLCLPLAYIAGKMMVVRALVSGCELQTAEPSSTPLELVRKPLDFAPLVPMQAATTLQQENGLEQLSRVRTILLGGGFIPPELEADLQQLPSRVYASYGMTETYSHVALRLVNGNERSEWYTPLRGVSMAGSEQSTLAITAPHLGIEQLVTNDIAEIRSDGSFRILGRRDAVISSGGIKIQAEELEQAIRSATGLTTLALPAPHAVLGQCVALLWEGEQDKDAGLRAAINKLPTYYRPRILRHVEELPRTATGKLSRAAAAALLR